MGGGSERLVVGVGLEHHPGRVVVGPFQPPVPEHVSTIDETVSEAVVVHGKPTGRTQID
jgi:hypothetical protein